METRALSVYIRSHTRKGQTDKLDICTAHTMCHRVKYEKIRKLMCICGMKQVFEMTQYCCPVLYLPHHGHISIAPKGLKKLVPVVVSLNATNQARERKRGVQQCGR